MIAVVLVPNLIKKQRNSKYVPISRSTIYNCAKESEISLAFSNVSKLLLTSGLLLIHVYYTDSHGKPKPRNGLKSGFVSLYLARLSHKTSTFVDY